MERSLSSSAPPEREWLVVRRLVGAGMVTLVGLDAGSIWMSSNGLPDPELFWHRILGRRGALLSQAESSALQQNQFFPNRDFATTLDRDVAGDIAMTGVAATGVFVGFIVFIAYWLVAGPLGYTILRKSGFVRHAWVGFVAAAGLFTALAWGGATALRPAQLTAKHFTIMDHVYGQGVDRARSFLTLLVPQYGEATAAIGDPATRDAQPFRNAIIPWENDGSTGAGFPDARGYRVDARSPDELTFPTRSTVKQFQMDWAGGPRLKMPRPVAAAGGEGEPKISIQTDAQGNAVIHGMLAHDLPAPLTDVTIVVVRGQRDMTRALYASPQRPLLCEAYAHSLTEPWAPGETIDLAAQIGRLSASGSATRRLDQADAFLKALTIDRIGRSDQGDGLDAGDSGRIMSRLLAMSFMHHLEPPEIREDTRQQMQAYQPFRLAQRRITHGYDLSAWLTQPCIIVIGQMQQPDPSQPPVPLFVSTGGAFREVKSSGRTLVRWVYPLPADPPEFVVRDAEPGTTPPEEPGGPL